MVNNQIEYDVFISYSDEDRSWVHGYLIDALEKADVTYHSEQTFELGVPKIAEFERGINQSKRTLLVLSPSYLSEKSNKFVNYLAQQNSLETQRWQIIPVILQPVKLPPNLTMLTPLDASEPSLWESAIARLSEQFNRPVPSSSPKLKCPYPGMIPFQEEDESNFYGRDEEIEMMLREIRMHPFLTVIGFSGSGKSSLVFAGLIPALKQSNLFGEGNWIVRSFRPGSTPNQILSNALGQKPEENIEQAISNLLIDNQDSNKLLIVVDQFEEIFVLANEKKKQEFENNLLSMIEIPNCFIALTVRSDFYSDLMKSLLWSQIKAHRFEVLALNDDGLRQAIINPADKVGVFVETALVERLIADAAKEPGILPLLQETLNLLWEKLERCLLPLNTYEDLVYVLPKKAYSFSYKDTKLTGLQVAIASRADQAINLLHDEKKEKIAQRIFIRLVQFGKGRSDTRRQLSLKELESKDTDEVMLNSILEHLVQYRLLVRGDELDKGDKEKTEVVDIAHDSLVYAWPKLREWIEEKREAEMKRRLFTYKVKEWARLGSLLDAAEIKEVKSWLESDYANILGYEEELLQLFEASKRRIQISKQVRTIVLSFIISLISLVIFSWDNTIRSKKRQQINNTLKADSASSDALLEDAQDFEALKQALAATIKHNNSRGVEIDTSNHVVSSLLKAIYSNKNLNPSQNNYRESNRLKGHQYSVTSLYLDFNNILYSGSNDTFIKLWDNENKILNELKFPENECTENINFKVSGIGLSRNGSRLVTTSSLYRGIGHSKRVNGINCNIVIWNKIGEDEFEVFKILDAHQSSVTGLQLVNDDDFFVTVGLDGYLNLWDFDGNNHKKWQINDVITSLSISNKNNIAIGTEKGNISIWHPFQGHQKDIINNSTDSELGIFSIAIDPKGTHIIAGHGNGSISIWQNQDQNNCYKSEFSNEHNHNGQVNQIAFDPIDEKFITASEDRTIKIWNLNGKLIQEIDAHSDGVRTAIFNRKDQSIISGGVDDLIRIWHKNLYSPVIFKAENEKRYMELPASKISFNSKFKTLVLAPESFNPENIEIWLLDKSETPYRVIENDDNRETISSIQVDSRGETIATGYMDGQINLWDIKNSQNLLSWNANSSKITSIDFSKDSKKLLVGSIEGDVTVWDISTRQPSLHKPLEKYTDDVINIVRFSSDNKLIASAGNDTTAKVWSLNGNSSFPLNEGHTNTILDIAISKDNKYFATAGRDKTIILWDNKGNPITTYIGHKDWVTSVAFDLKNQRLFSGSKDGTVKMWSLESGLEISTFSHHLDLTNSLGQDNISINHLEYDSDNEILVSIDSNGNLLEWDLNIDRLTHRACNWMEGYIKSNIYATHQFKDCHSYFNTPLK